MTCLSQKLLTFCTLAAVLVACSSSPPASPIIPLAFYLASDAPFPGASPIDMGDYLSPIFIGPYPDLTLDHIGNVTAGQMIDFNRRISIRPGVTTSSNSTARIDTFALTLLPNDVSKLTALTDQAAGRTLVIMLGTTVLQTIRLATPFTKKKIVFSLDPGIPDAEKQRITDELQALAP